MRAAVSGVAYLRGGVDAVATDLMTDGRDDVVVTLPPVLDLTSRRAAVSISDVVVLASFVGGDNSIITLISAGSPAIHVLAVPARFLHT